MASKVLRMIADYGVDPLFDANAADYVEPEDLGLSAGLAADLADWQAVYDALLDLDDVENIGDPPADFNDRGRALADRIQAEVGDRYQVEYGEV